MRIALLQLNPTVGDIAGNAERLLKAASSAAASGAQLAVASELGLIGYPPRDLVLRQGVVERCEAEVSRLAQRVHTAAPGLTLVVGHPRRVEGGSRPLRNSLSVLQDGVVSAVYDKRLLPTYDVFDEDRYFEPGDKPCIISVAGKRIGLMICEDLWRADDVTAERRYRADPFEETAGPGPNPGCDLVVVPSASPFIIGKARKHRVQLAALANRHRVPIISVNQVGANDDVIFDGGSAVFNAMGAAVCLLPSWREAVEVVDLAANASPIAIPELAWEHEIFHALVLGIRDYVRKTGHERVLIGLSGGIDSALTASLAVAAVGTSNVRGITMPSRYSSTGSIEDSRVLAENLGIRFDTVPILESHNAVTAALAAAEPSATIGIADENAQARLRGLLLMSIANATNALVLATGNKSEMAAGYCTLYGDMCGALAVLGDVTKTRVWALSRWINSNHARCGFDRPPIPVSSIEKAPSAELRPNQTDQDSLPPYEVLDRIVEGAVDLELDAACIAREHGIDEALVLRWMRALDRTEYKRAQAALILKVTDRAFGPGRRYPLAQRS